MHEQNTQEQLNQQQYMEQVLQKHNVTDSEGRTRDLYNIAGHDVMFRNRQETVSLADSPYVLPEGPGQNILPLDISQEEAKGKWVTYRNGASAEADPTATIVVTNNPEGVLAAAALLAPEKAAEFSLLGKEMSEGRYGKPAFDLIDKLAACSYMNEEGGVGLLNYGDIDQRGDINLDAPALVLASLLGDQQAESIVKDRVEAMHHYLEVQKVGSLATNGAQYAEWQGHRAERVKAIKPENVALVHSTAHDIEYDDQGNIILYPASSKRDDKYPRATLHFTPNSQVVQHFMAGDAWGQENKLIAGNMAAMIEANGTPSVINDVDTFFTLNPGERLKIPGALLVEPASQGQQELIVQDGNVIRYKQVADSEYTDDEKHTLKLLKMELHDEATNEPLATSVREVALRKAMAALGVAPTMMSRGGAHYVDNARLQDALTALSYEMGVGQGLHVYTPESRLEDASKQAGMREVYEVDKYAVSDFTLPALRQVIASGYMPARRARVPLETSGLVF